MAPPSRRFTRPPASQPASKPSRPSLNKQMSTTVTSLIKGLSVAPDLSPDAPCVFLLPSLFDTFIQLAHDIGTSQGRSLTAYIRFEHGELLDAVVTFANATWTPEQRKTWESCRCQKHKNVKTRPSCFRRILGNVHNQCRGYPEDLFCRAVYHVFLFVSQVAQEIAAIPAEVIRLERAREKRGKWPSSPSKFIPHSPATTVSAFIGWARMIQDALPLGALSELASSCPSLEPPLIQSSELLPLIAELFAQAVQTAKTRGPTACDADLERQILSFSYIFEAAWFSETMVRILANPHSKLTMVFVSIYASLCDFLPILEPFVFSIARGLERMKKDRFRLAGTIIFYGLSRIVPLIAHDTFLTYANFNNEGLEVYSLAINAMNLRNQVKCAGISCTQTNESTRSNFKFCSACLAVRYCSKTCQIGDWKEHKLVCKGLKAVMPISFAYFSLPSAEWESRELSQKYLKQLKEEGFTDEDVARMREYVRLHKRKPGDIWSKEMIETEIQGSDWEGLDSQDSDLGESEPEKLA